MVGSNAEWESARTRQDGEAAQERARAEKLWRQLQDVADAEARQELALGDPGFSSWAVCEKLCHESAAAADDGDSDRAGELAQLALKLSSKVPGEEHLRCRIREYVWAHVGYARRAQGDLDGAGKALARAAEFFVAGTMGILPSPIQRDRIYLIEAALLRDRGRLNEALEKVKQSFGGLTDSGVKVALFLEEARLCRWLGRHRKAMEAFALADRDVPKVSDPRLRLRLEIERGLTLCDLGQHGEAGNLPADLRKTAAGLPIEQARLLCLQGRIAAGLGQPETAAQHLQTALAGLPDRALVDAALLALELAALYAHLGRMDELKVLTAETLKPLAEAPALSRGAAASLRLFCRLADQDKMSAERAAQFARDFPRGLV